MLKRSLLALLSIILIVSADNLQSQEDAKEHNIDYMGGKASVFLDLNAREDLTITTIEADTLNEPPLTPGWWTRGIAAGSDLDEDGQKEIIITDYSINGIHIYECTGDNTFEWVATYEDPFTTYTTTPRHVITADLDQNGRGEIIFLGMRDPLEPFNGLNVLEWDGIPGSDTYTRYVIPIGLDGPDGGTLDRYYGDRTLNVGDVDNDGFPEIMISINGSDNASDVFLIAQVMGEFEMGDADLALEYINVRSLSGDFNGSPWGQPNWGDMDGDGLNEVYFLAWDHATMLTVEVEDFDIYMLQSIVELDSAYTDKVVYGTTHVTDVDGDGRTELYGGMYNSGWFFQVTADDVADIGFENGDIAIYDGGHAYWDVTGGDVNGDGVEELFSIEYDHARITQWTWNGVELIPTLLYEWTDLMGGFSLDYAGDLDGDGNPELVQGFLETPYSELNPSGHIFAIIEIGDVPVGQVQFSVDMEVQEAQGAFDPTTDVVELRGSFNAGGQDPALVMLEAGNTGIYTASFDFQQYEFPSTHTYNFVIVKPEVEIPELDGLPREFIYAGVSQVLPTVYFDDDDEIDEELEPWVINIFIEAGGIFDWDNQLGMDLSATTGYDADYDHPEPPLPPTEYAQMYFPHPDWDIPIGPNFRTDIRELISLSDTVVIWDFDFITDIPFLPIFMDFEEGSNPPEVSTFILEDLTSGVVYDLNEGMIIDYESEEPGVRHFRLHIGNGSNATMTRIFDPGWHLFSLPIIPTENSIWDVLEPGATENFYVYEYYALDGYQTVDRLYRGVGYWLATLADLSVQVEGGADQSQFNEWLDFGWNLISNPFISSRPIHTMQIEFNDELYDFQTAVNNGWISNAIYGYEAGGYHQAFDLTPWNGYWLFAMEHGLHLVMDYEQGLNAIDPRESRSEDEWYLTVKTHQENNADLITEIGVHPDATIGFDVALDAPEPPISPTPASVSSYFVHQNWNEFLGTRYNRDIRSPLLMNDEHTWEMTVSSEPGDVVLSWTYEEGTFPDSLHFTLTDVEGGQVVDMLNQDTYPFNNVSGESIFLVEARRAYVGLDPSMLPIEYVLHQNYPNPFNPSTTLAYGLPDMTHVRMRILNLLGQEIALLVDEEQTAGWHDCSWSGLDREGHLVDAGVYFAQIDMGSESRIVKMLLMK